MSIMFLTSCTRNDVPKKNIYEGNVIESRDWIEDQVGIKHWDTAYEGIAETITTNDSITFYLPKDNGPITFAKNSYNKYDANFGDLNCSGTIFITNDTLIIERNCGANAPTLDHRKFNFRGYR